MDVVNPTVRWLQKNATDDPEGFWAQRAEALPWFRRWDRVLDWTPPTFRWFVGAETNLAWNCVDRHVTGGRTGPDNFRNRLLGRPAVVVNGTKKAGTGAVGRANMRPEAAGILTFYMGKNTPERKDYIMDKLVVPVEE